MIIIPVLWNVSSTGPDRFGSTKKKEKNVTLYICSERSAFIRCKIQYWYKNPYELFMLLFWKW